MNSEKLKQVIEILKKLVSETLETIEDKDILEQAVKIYLSENNISEKKSQEPSAMKPATEKQIEFARSLGFKGDASKLSSKQMSDIIKELKDKPRVTEEKIGEDEYDY
jgi:hypothetical protein